MHSFGGSGSRIWRDDSGTVHPGSLHEGSRKGSRNENVVKRNVVTHSSLEEFAKIKSKHKALANLNNTSLHYSFSFATVLPCTYGITITHSNHFYIQRKWIVNL